MSESVDTPYSEACRVVRQNWAYEEDEGTEQEIRDIVDALVVRGLTSFGQTCRASQASPPEPTDLEALLAGELSRHGMSGHGRCRCGVWWTASDQYGNVDQFKAHLAAVLAAALVPWVAQREADVLREAAYRASLDLGNEVGGHTSTYSVRRWLRARADRVAPTTEETQ